MNRNKKGNEEVVFKIHYGIEINQSFILCINLDLLLKEPHLLPIHDTHMLKYHCLWFMGQCFNLVSKTHTPHHQVLHNY